MNLSAHAFALLAAAALVACDGKQELATAEHGQAEEHAHVHEPMFGGALVELGDHVANLEVLLAPETGELTIYLLDGHASNTVRAAQETLALTVEPEGGEPFALTLKQVASALSGEKVGDSSTYKVQDDRLKGLDHLHGDVASVEMLGTTFKDIEVSWPAGEHDHDH
ncbi:MAG: hypothetical protein R3F49_09850 [Planctomycetota bacterium]